jgi:hypothetical protein
MRRDQGSSGQFCGRTRREFLWETGAGFTGMALAGYCLLALNTNEFAYVD